MRSTRLIPASALALAATLAAASPALAGPPTVKERIAKADSALASAHTHAKAGRDTAALRSMRSADALTDAALRQARRGSRSSRSLDNRRVAAQFQENAERFAALITHLDGRADASAANAVGASMKGRATALDRLESLAGLLPAAAQKGLGRSVTAVTNAAGKPVTTLDRALRSGTVDASSVKNVDSAILAVATASVGDVSRLDALAETLPAAARRGIDKARERTVKALGEMGARFTGAQDCAAERDADATAFDEKYRTNTPDEGDESNAYGMCVSGRAKAMRPGGAGRPAGLPGPAADIVAGAIAGTPAAGIVGSLLPGGSTTPEDSGSTLPIPDITSMIPVLRP
jgi:hypothetical protein